MNFVTKILVTANAIAKHPLRSRSRMGAIWQFALSQVAARLVPGEVIVPFPNGTKLIIPPRMKGAAHFISPGLCEYEEMSFVAHFLRADDLFVDVGANIGAYTLLAAGVAGATVVALEPSPLAFASLVETVRLNDLAERVTTLNIAVGSRPGELFLTEGLGTENHLCVDHQASVRLRPVAVQRLDDILSNKSPALIKIDVEGFESEVISGAQSVLAQETLQAFIIERADNAVRYGFDESKLHTHIQQLGFTPWAYDPRARSIGRLPLDARGNLIYLRNPDRVQERCRTATRFTFSGFEI